MGLKETILSANDLPQEAVDVAEWGCTVYIRTLTGEEISAYLEGGQTTPIRLLAACLMDAAGQRVFAASEIDILSRKSGRVLDRLCNIALRMNGLGGEAEKN